MKQRLKYILLPLFILVCVAGKAQTHIVSYEYWFDGLYAARQQYTPAASPTVQFKQAIDASSVNHGLHVLHTRATDSEGTKSVVHSQVFYKQKKALDHELSIEAYEYWIDNDFEERRTQTTSASKSFFTIDQLDMNGLEPGLHVLHIRSKDNLGHWGVAFSQVYYKNPVSEGGNQISAYEYWIDNGFSERKKQPASTAQDITFINQIALTELAQGLHVLNIRAKEDTGIWSPVYSQVFFKNAPFGGTPSITTCEYWIDEQFETRKSSSVDAAQDIALLSELDTEGIEPGFHVFCIRFKDHAGRWSAPRSMLFYQNASVAGGNKIDAYCYWFDQHFDEAALILLHTPANPYELQAAVEVPDSLQLGEHSLHIRFRDQLGKWSTVHTDLFVKTGQETSILTPILHVLRVYPNPFENQLIVLPEDLRGAATATLIDVQGKVVWNSAVEIETSEVTLQIPELPQGVYFLNIRGEQKDYQMKVLRK